MTEKLSDGVVRRRAKSGIFFVGSWGAMNLVVGFGGNLVLARLLTPRDFGIVAIGATLMMLTTSIADGGLGSGLIRLERTPERRELKAALALQLSLTGTLAVLAAGVGALVGGAGHVVALMMCALPVAALQTPGRVMLSRAMRFKALSTVEAVANLAYYGWAIALVVAADAGVWALASAVVVRAVALAAGVSGVARLALLPSYRGATALRDVIAFGLRFQGVSLAGMLREQGLNAGVAAISGVGTLGLWTLTKRLLEFPALMFEPLHRVSFPVLSHMLAAKQDPARMLDRGVAVASTASGVVLVSMAAASPVLVAVAFSLLPAVGPAAIGMGSLAGAIVDAAIMARAIRKRSSSRPLDGLLPTLAVAAIAAPAGLAVSAAAGPGVLAGVEGGLRGPPLHRAG